MNINTESSDTNKNQGAILDNSSHEPVSNNVNQKPIFNNQRQMANQGNRGGGLNRGNRDRMMKGKRPNMPGMDGGNEWSKNSFLSGAPTYDLPIKEKKEMRKFTGRCRIFVANLPTNITEDALRKLFEPYGEVAEIFLGKGNSFAFVKMDTRQNAEAARTALDLKNYEGRNLRVRLAAHPAAIKVKNLTSTVTCELLEFAFSFFGEIERAFVIADGRGRSIGEGVVEFARKSSAQAALKKCSEECFLLTSIPKPVIVEPFEDNEETFSEKAINKQQNDFMQERSVGPHFPEPGSFEHKIGEGWKNLFEVYKQKKEKIEIEHEEDIKAFMEQMEYARLEHQTNMLKEQVKKMEEQCNKRKSNLMEDERIKEERQRQEMALRQQTEKVLGFQQPPPDFSNLRRQENELRSKANALQDLLERQEQSLRQVSATGVSHNSGEPLFNNRMGGGPMNNIGKGSGNMQGPPPLQQPMPPFQGNLGFDPGLVGPGGPGGPGGPLNGPGVPMGPGSAPNRPQIQMRGPQQQQRFNRPKFNAGPQQIKRRRF